MTLHRNCLPSSLMEELSRGQIERRAFRKLANERAANGNVGSNAIHQLEADGLVKCVYQLTDLGWHELMKMAVRGKT